MNYLRLLFGIAALIGGLVLAGGAALESWIEYQEARAFGGSYTIYYGLVLTGFGIAVGIGLLQILAAVVSIREEKERKLAKSGPSSPAQPTASAQSFAQVEAQPTPPEAPQDERAKVLATIALRAMSAMAAADGKFSQNELNLMRRILIDEFEFDVTEENAKNYYSQMASDLTQVEQDMVANRDKMSFEEHQKMLKAAAMIAYVDGELDDRERKLLERISASLDLEKSEMDTQMVAAFNAVQAIFREASSG